MGAIGVAFDKKKYDKEWVKENCVRYELTIRKDTGIPDAIAKLREEKISFNQYAQEIIKAKLIADGYLSSEPEQREDG